MSIDRRLFHFLSILLFTEPSTSLPFFPICVDISNAEIPFHFDFSRGIHRSSSFFEKLDKHTNGNFQGSDEWSIDLVENKDWCLRGDRVRCQLSGTRTGRHFGERYAARRFGTVSNLSHGHQVINFGSIYHNKSVKWIFPFRSMILSRRINDDDHRDGFTKWPFMTTHTWGEYPQGNWLLEVSNRVVPFLSPPLSREKIE